MSELRTTEPRNVPLYAKEGMTLIKGVAIRQGHLMFSLPRPARHHDLIAAMVKAGIPAPIGPRQGYEQGFAWCNGEFKDRERAAAIIGKTEPRCLYSEDLW